MDHNDIEYVRDLLKELKRENDALINQPNDTIRNVAVKNADAIRGSEFYSDGEYVPSDDNQDVYDCLCDYVSSVVSSNLQYDMGIDMPFSADSRERNESSYNLIDRHCVKAVQELIEIAGIDNRLEERFVLTSNPYVWLTNAHDVASLVKSALGGGDLNALSGLLPERPDTCNTFLYDHGHVRNITLEDVDSFIEDLECGLEDLEKEIIEETFAEKEEIA